MTSPFPQLLRRSKFAAHDPLITRVYTSTPSSVHQHGDWGMKFPIHRAKGPRNVTVHELDTGTILGSDWRSAEKEARFMENWGRAGRWTNRDLEEQKKAEMLQGGLPFSSRLYAERDLESERQAAEEMQEGEKGRMVMPDVNAMSRKQFARYIAQVRRERGTFLATKLAGMRERDQAKAKPQPTTTAGGGGEGDVNANATLVDLATRGLAGSGDTAHFQATMTHNEVGSTESKRIHSTPHRMYGLTYAAPTPAASTRPIAGRVVNRNLAADRGGSGSGSSYYNNRKSAHDDNKPWVVSVGGLTGQLSNANASVRDGQRVQSTDYTRSDPAQGEYRFKIGKAELQGPPTVQNLQQSNKALRWAMRRDDRRLGAKQPSPFDTFQFDIQLENADAIHASDAGGETAAQVPGSKEWVGREPGSGFGSRFTSEEDRLGLVGSPRHLRTQGETLAHLRDLENTSVAGRKAAREAERQWSEQNKSVSANLVRRLGFKRNTEGRA